VKREVADPKLDGEAYWEMDGRGCRAEEEEPWRCILGSIRRDMGIWWVKRGVL
jgi:hypothetical protein